MAGQAALAECSGGLGRGWARGGGEGRFEMPASDGACPIPYPAFIDDSTDERTPATEIGLTRAPASGQLGRTAGGMVYTPTPGFTGADQFCIRNSTPEVPGQTLSGCITVTVR